MGFKLVRTELTRVYDSSFVDDMYLLDNKINYYLNWYIKNVREFSLKELKNVIEKITNQYELRYPDLYLDQGDIDSILFKEVDFHGCNQQQWCDFYNFDKFYLSLSECEKTMLDKPRYPQLIYLVGDRGFHIHVGGDATLMMEYLANDGDENLVCFVNYFDDGKLVKKTIKEVLSSQNLVGISSKQKVKVFPNTDIQN